MAQDSPAGLHNAFNDRAMMEDAASLGPEGQADQLCAKRPQESLNKATLAPVQPTNGKDATRRPQSRALQVTVTLTATIGWRDPEGKGRSIGAQLDDALLKVTGAVGIADENGMPVATLPTQEVTLPLVDGVEYKTPGERLDALLKRTEAQAVEAWEAQQHGS